MDYTIDTDCFKGLLIQPQDGSYEFLPSLRSYHLEIRERSGKILRYVRIQAFLSIMLGAVDRTEHHLKFKALDLSVNFESIEDPDRLQENCDLESWEKQTKQAVEQVGRLVEVLLAMVKFRDLARMCFEHSMRCVAKKTAEERLKAELSYNDQVRKISAGSEIRSTLSRGFGSEFPIAPFTADRCDHWDRPEPPQLGPDLGIFPQLARHPDPGQDDRCFIR
jgi:hypothetical protein